MYFVIFPLSLSTILNNIETILSSSDKESFQRIERQVSNTSIV